MKRKKPVKRDAYEMWLEEKLEDERAIKRLQLGSPREQTDAMAFAYYSALREYKAFKRQRRKSK